MTTVRRAAGVLWPAVLLSVFIGTFRRVPGHASQKSDTTDCGAAPAVSTSRDVAALERCASEDANDVALLTALGGAYESSGRVDRAETTYRRALDIDPRDGDLRVRLGELLLKRGDRAGARRQAEAALEWHPNSAGAADLAVKASDAETDQ